MIPVNFASKNYRAIERVFQALVAGSVLLLLAAGGTVWKAVALRSELSATQRKVHDAEAADEQVKSMLGEREKLVKDLGSMTGLLDARKFSWTGFFTSIETVVPVGVALNKVEFNPGDRSLTLEGKAQSPEALRNLVVGLEKSDSFRDPLLKHQSIEKGIISFNVVAVYHEYKRVGVAQGKK